jgi:hypothetical protein
MPRRSHNPNDRIEPFQPLGIDPEQPVHLGNPFNFALAFVGKAHNAR